MKKRIVVGISGASGAPIAVELLRRLAGLEEWESHLVISRGGKITLGMETGCSLQTVKDLADVYYEDGELGAAIASGSFRTSGMVVVPCSMKTVAGIANGFSENLLLRAADVTLKENRPLILVTREMPLSCIHLKNMSALAQMGAVILPPMLTFYHDPSSIQDMTDHVVGKILDRFSISDERYRRWKGLELG